MEISLYLCAGQNVLLQLGRVHLAMFMAGNSGAFDILCCPSSLETPWPGWRVGACVLGGTAGCTKIIRGGFSRSLPYQPIVVWRAASCLLGLQLQVLPQLPLTPSRHVFRA